MLMRHLLPVSLFRTTRVSSRSDRSLKQNLTRLGLAIAALALVGSQGKVIAAPSQTPDTQSADLQKQSARLTPIVPIRTPRFCQSDLQAAINSIVDRPTFDNAQWGIAIAPLADSEALYDYNSDASLIPASNIKLLTTSAALEIVGARTPDLLRSLEAWINTVNRYSDNDYADALLSRIGGQSAVKQALSNLGVNPDDYEQIDGSGLSRDNRAKPSTFLTILKGMHTQNDEGTLFYDSLAVAGVSGTLRNRFIGTLAQGKIHGKTGTLQGVRALSGYVENADYGTIAFSILVNQPDQSGDVLVQAIDQIALQMTKVTRCQ